MAEKKKEDNLSLWESVHETDPKYTKPVKYGSREFTAIQPQYQLLMATEQFGPFGIGFGVKDTKFTTIKLDDSQVVVGYEAVLWYMHGGNKGEFDISSSIVLASLPKSGSLRIDIDAYKKVSTDALTKGLSKLGFNADVFLGQYDDYKYVDMLEEKYEKNMTTDAKKPKNDKKPSDVSFIISRMEKASTLGDLDRIADEISSLENLYSPEELAELNVAFDDNEKRIKTYPDD